MALNQQLYHENRIKSYARTCYLLANKYYSSSYLHLICKKNRSEDFRNYLALILTSNLLAKTNQDIDNTLLLESYNEILEIDSSKKNIYRTMSKLSSKSEEYQSDTFITHFVSTSQNTLSVKREFKKNPLLCISFLINILFLSASLARKSSHNLIKTNIKKKDIYNLALVLTFQSYFSSRKIQATNEDIVSNSWFLYTGIRVEIYLYSTSFFLAPYLLFMPKESKIITSSKIAVRALNSFGISAIVDENQPKRHAISLTFESKFPTNSALVVDVTPKDEEHLKRIGLYSPYSLNMLDRFVTETIQLAQSKNLKIFYKQKRTPHYSSIDDTSYYQRIMNTLKDSNNVEFLETQIDACNYLQYFSICIGMPVTTPLLLAVELNKTVYCHSRSKYGYNFTGYESLTDYSNVHEF